MAFAHAAAQGGVEIELLLIGAGFLAAAFFFRPSQTGNPRAAVVCLVLGIGLATGAFAVPRLSPEEHHPSDAQVAIVMPEDGADLVAGQPVRVAAELTGGKLARSADAESGGHIHLYVDGEIKSMPYSLQTQVTFEPGEHTLRVEYVDVDHGAFTPPVEDEVSVTVR